jgi:hypothetical protein
MERKVFSESGLRFIRIPTEIETLDYKCFSGCSNLRAISFDSPSKLRNIENKAFSGSKVTIFGRDLDRGILTVTFPASVEKIGEHCFADQRSLRLVSFDRNSSLKEIGMKAFVGFGGIDVDLPATVEHVKGESLVDVRRLTLSKDHPFFVIKNGFLKTSDGKKVVRYLGSKPRVIIKKDIEIVGSKCFFFTRVNEVIFERGSRLRRLRSGAFGLERLTKITIPSSCELISKDCFRLCAVLREVHFERRSSLLRIGAGAFSETGLERLLLPAFLEDIGDGCFSSCKSLLEVRFESGSKLRAVGNQAFRESGLRKITLPSSLESLGSWCFFRCASLVEVNFEAESKLREIPDSCFKESGLTNIIVPRSVEVLGEYCFQACKALTAITFETGSQLKEICRLAFHGTSLAVLEIPPKCEKLSGICLISVERLTVSNENPFFVIEKDFLMRSGDAKCLVRYLGSESTFVCSKEIDEIGEGCFAFRKCIEKVVLEENSRVQRLGPEAFMGTSIREIIIPASVDIIDHGCFRNCVSLTTVEFEPKPKLREIKAIAFAGTQISEIEIPASCESLPGALVGIRSIVFSPENRFFAVRGDFIIKNSEEIRLVRYMGAQSRVVIPNDVEVIDLCCFCLCDAVHEIIFEPKSNVRRIEGRAFPKTEIERIEIPESVEYIGDMCFESCKSLREVTFLGKVPEFGLSPFFRCDVKCIRVGRGVEVPHIPSMHYRIGYL